MALSPTSSGAALLEELTDIEGAINELGNGSEADEFYSRCQGLREAIEGGGRSDLAAEVSALAAEVQEFQRAYTQSLVDVLLSHFGAAVPPGADGAELASILASTRSSLDALDSSSADYNSFLHDLYTDLNDRLKVFDGYRDPVELLHSRGDFEALLRDAEHARLQSSSLAPASRTELLNSVQNVCSSVDESSSPRALADARQTVAEVQLLYGIAPSASTSRSPDGFPASVLGVEEAEETDESEEAEEAEEEEHLPQEVPSATPRVSSPSPVPSTPRAASRSSGRESQSSSVHATDTETLLAQTRLRVLQAVARRFLRFVDPSDRLMFLALLGSLEISMDGAASAVEACESSESIESVFWQSLERFSRVLFVFQSFFPRIPPRSQLPRPAVRELLLAYRDALLACFPVLESRSESERFLSAFLGDENLLERSSAPACEQLLGEMELSISVHPLLRDLLRLTPPPTAADLPGETDLSLLFPEDPVASTVAEPQPQPPTTSEAHLSSSSPKNRKRSSALSLSTSSLKSLERSFDLESGELHHILEGDESAVGECLRFRLEDIEDYMNLNDSSDKNYYMFQLRQLRGFADRMQELRLGGSSHAQLLGNLLEWLRRGISLTVDLPRAALVRTINVLVDLLSLSSRMERPLDSMLEIEFQVIRSLISSIPPLYRCLSVDVCLPSVRAGAPEEEAPEPECVPEKEDAGKRREFEEYLESVRHSAKGYEKTVAAEVLRQLSFVEEDSHREPFQGYNYYRATMDNYLNQLRPLAESSQARLQALRSHIHAYFMNVQEASESCQKVANKDELIGYINFVEQELDFPPNPSERVLYSRLLKVDARLRAHFPEVFMGSSIIAELPGFEFSDDDLGAVQKEAQRYPDYIRTTSRYLLDPKDHAEVDRIIGDYIDQISGATNPSAEFYVASMEATNQLLSEEFPEYFSELVHESQMLPHIVLKRCMRFLRQSLKKLPADSASDLLEGILREYSSKYQHSAPANPDDVLEHVRRQVQLGYPALCQKLDQMIASAYHSNSCRCSLIQLLRQFRYLACMSYGDTIDARLMELMQPTNLRIESVLENPSKYFIAAKEQFLLRVQRVFPSLYQSYLAMFARPDAATSSEREASAVVALDVVAPPTPPLSSSHQAAPAHPSGMKAPTGRATPKTYLRPARGLATAGTPRTVHAPTSKVPRPKTPVAAAAPVATSAPLAPAVVSPQSNRSKFRPTGQTAAYKMMPNAIGRSSAAPSGRSNRKQASKIPKRSPAAPPPARKPLIPLANVDRKSLSELKERRKKRVNFNPTKVLDETKLLLNIPDYSPPPDTPNNELIYFLYEILLKATSYYGLRMQTVYSNRESEFDRKIPDAPNGDIVRTDARLSLDRLYNRVQAMARYTSARLTTIHDEGSEYLMSNKPSAHSERKMTVMETIENYLTSNHGDFYDEFKRGTIKNNIAPVDYRGKLICLMKCLHVVAPLLDHTQADKARYLTSKLHEIDELVIRHPNTEQLYYRSLIEKVETLVSRAVPDWYKSFIGLFTDSK